MSDSSSSTFRIKCQSCKKEIRVPDSARGKTGKCPGCASPIKIPVAEPVADTSNISQTSIPARKPQPASPSAVEHAPKAHNNPNIASPSHAGEQSNEHQSPAANSSDAIPPATNTLSANNGTTIPQQNQSNRKVRKGINLAAQIIFFLIFCLAAFFLGSLREIVPSRGIFSLLPFVAVGLALGFFALVATWFVLIRVPFWMRALMLVGAAVVFVGAAVGGCQFSEGIGPISPEEMTEGAPGLLVLLMAFQLPLWGLIFFGRVGTPDFEIAGSGKRQSLVPHLLLGFVIVVATILCFVVAKLPGIENVNSWGIAIAVVFTLGIVTILPANFVALKINPGWLASIVAIAHVSVFVGLIFLGNFMELIDDRAFGGVMTATIFFLLAMYLPLKSARFCGFRLSKGERV